MISGPRRRFVPGTTGKGFPAAGALALLLAGTWPAPVLAQSSIVVDDTLPGVAREELAGPDYRIDETRGALNGANLFFSFERFGLTAAESATFEGPASVERIVSRVTGGDISSIDGLLRSDIDGASLYLVNPAGIVIGENAELDIQGGFHVSTADVLEFADGGEFHASNPALDTPLSMAPIAAWGFLGGEPAPIEIRGAQLLSGELRPMNPVDGSREFRGASVSILGGDVSIGAGSSPARRAFVYTGGARLDIVALDGPGRVRIVETVGDEGLEVEPVGGTPVAFGDVQLDGGTELVTGGPPPGTSLATAIARGSGDVRIRARDLTLEDARIRSVTTTTDAAGDIDVALSGDFFASTDGMNRPAGLVSGSGFVFQVQDPSTPVAARIRNAVFSPRTTIVTALDADGEIVSISHEGTGTGGEIRVVAENVTLEDGAKLSSTAFFGGDGGLIDVDARDTVRLDGRRADGEPGGLFANALLGGDSGAIEVNARLLAIDDRAGIFGEVRDGDGRGGDVTIEIETLEIDGSGRIDTTTRGAGDGGEITIDATRAVRLSGRQDDFFFSSVTTFSLDEAGGAEAGAAGTILITTPELTLSDGAGLSTAAVGRGDGGVIDVRADVIELSASEISSTAILGEAGDVYLNAGPLDPDLTVRKPAGVPSGERIALQNSRIITDANGGEGSGGDVVIDPRFYVMQDSRITATAREGAGGNIVIVANELIVDADSVFDASSGVGLDGTITLTSSGQALRADLESLPAVIPDAVQLLRAPCAARQSGERVSSFVVTERQGLPPSAVDAVAAPIPIEADALGTPAEGVASRGGARTILGEYDCLPVRSISEAS